MTKISEHPTDININCYPNSGLETPIPRFLSHEKGVLTGCHLLHTPPLFISVGKGIF